MEGAPQPLHKEQIENQLDKLRADRDAYLHRLTEGDLNVGSALEIMEANAADKQLQDFNTKIEELERKLA